jgi:hypothetical protein
MAAFLFVTAAATLLAGLVGLVAGHVPWTVGRPHALRTAVGSRGSRAN